MSSNEAFDVEHFDDLIAAVDSIDIPADSNNEPEPPTLTVDESLSSYFISDIDFGGATPESSNLSSRHNELELHSQLDAINDLSSSDDAPSDVPLLLRKKSASLSFDTAKANGTPKHIDAVASQRNQEDTSLSVEVPTEQKEASSLQLSLEEPLPQSSAADATELTLEPVPEYENSTPCLEIDDDFGELESMALENESVEAKPFFASKEPAVHHFATDSDLTKTADAQASTGSHQPATDDVSDDFAELESLSLSSEPNDSVAVFDSQEPAAQPFVATVDFAQTNQADTTPVTEELNDFDDALSELDSLPLSNEAVEPASTDLLDGFGELEESVDFSLRECATSRTTPVPEQEKISYFNNSDEATVETAEAAQPLPASNNEPAAPNSQETIVLSQNNGTSVNHYLKNSPHKKPTRKLSLNYLSQRFPLLYLGMSAVMALCGFAYILMIPALFGIAMFNSFEMLTNPFTSNTLLLMLAYFSISLFLFLVSYKLFDLKFVGPEGVTLDESNGKSLLEKLGQLKREHRVPAIHQIVLTRRHELNVIKVPRFGLPVWSKNVLAVGYPLLQTLTPDQFNAALSRRLLQHAKRRNVVLNWLSFMRRTWTLYAESLKQRNGVIDLLHYCFFAPYASAYRRFAVYVTQKDELMADEAALEFNNDRDLVKGAQTIRITQAMLLQYFWPKLDEAIRNHLSAPAHIRPYHNLPGTLSELLNSKNIDTWFIRLAQETKNPGGAEAPFYYRMERMGHSKVSVPRSFDLSAARHYFGDAYEQMTDQLDDMWAREVQEALFIENLKEDKKDGIVLPSRLSIEPA